MRFPRYPKYKDCGVGWLREVPEHWEVTRLRYLCQCLDGVRVPLNAAQRSDKQGEIPYWGANSIVDWVDDALFDEDLVLLGEDGAPFFEPSTPVAFFTQGKVWPNNHIHVLRPITPETGKFIVYGLNVTDYAQFVDGSTRDKLTQSAMNDIPLAWPPFSEQTLIEKFLERETTKIDKLVGDQRRLIELLIEKRQAVISHAVTKGLNPHVSMKPSGIEWLGPIPSHWELKRLKNVTLPHRGIQMGPFGAMLKDLESIPTPYKLYGQENTINNDFGAGSRWLSKERFQSLQEYEVRPGDVVLTRKGASIGNCRVIPKGVQMGVIDSDTIRVRLVSEVISTDFVVTLMHEGYMESAILERQKGAVLPGLNTGTIANLQIAVPPIDEQNAIVSYLAKQQALFHALSAEAQRGIDLLQERRTALISAAVTGKIDVRESVRTVTA